MTASEQAARRLLLLVLVVGAGASAQHQLEDLVGELARITSALQQTTCPADYLTLVHKLGMQKTPAGTYYTPVFTSDKPSTEPGVAATNTILELQPAGTRIPWLNINSNSQPFVWHHRGAAVAFHTLSASGRYQRMVLGDPLRHRGAKYQLALPTGGWLATEVLSDSEYVLLSGSAVPALDRLQYTLAEPARLLQLFPQHKDVIRAAYGQT
ncbi:uncharacterized protein LOC119091288 [Pollicipes pollicipes]|uniref:uncharacterized protein LOC119091288 n=1 Tax=Pollicipes pollicipes TaxID=41117 RepID=UPI00188543FF|nr:uncharacterized protein LOC119091288 [Pollicipes pollicipes]